jgi:hypothetical protein
MCVPLIWLHQATFRFPALYNAQRADDPRYIPQGPSIMVMTVVTMHPFSRVQNTSAPLRLTVNLSTPGDCCCIISILRQHDADQYNA